MNAKHCLLLVAIVLAAAGCSKLTPENYAKIKPGMTYEEVRAILGSPDRCDDLMGFKSCRWGDDSKNITVRFAKDQVLLHSAENIR
jgi:outer membrane protein assembly factor BamE (lipoprotein component of BamABCDE complex)